MALLMAATLGSVLVLPEVAGGAAAVAKLAEDVGDAVGSIVRASTNLTTSTADLAAALARTSYGLSAELWSGVDLVNVTVHRQGARLLADSGSELARVLGSAEGATIAPIPDEWCGAERL